MALYCLVCKKANVKGCGRCYFRFPRDPDVRRLWFNSLCIPKHTVLPAQARICSDHFTSKDYIVKQNGIKGLSENAVPVLAGSSAVCKIEPIFTNSSYQNIDIENGHGISHISTVEEDSTILIVSSDTAEDDSNSLQLNDQNGKPLVNDISYTPESDTDQTTTESQRKRKMTMPRYFGDCNPENLNNPALAQLNWDIAESTVGRQRKKIKILQQTVRRLKIKSYTLKLLIKYLKDNDLVTETGHSVIEPFLRE